MFEGISALLLIAAVITWTAIKIQDWRWEVFLESRDSGPQVEELHRKFAVLKNNGVRCRLKTIFPRVARGFHPSTQTTMRIEVHKSDLNEAYRIISQTD